MMEYHVPNQRPHGGLESYLEQSMVQNLPHQRMQELNEAMGQMSIQPSDSLNGVKMSSGPYPERAGVADCTYYSRTGTCAFGMNCRFNHPPNSKQVPWTGDTPQKAGQIECQFYVKGACKFGTMCKYEHSNQKEGCGRQLQFNFMGLPIREGERECPYYNRTGSCKYGVTCKFHHPEPGSEGMSGSVSTSPLQMTRTNPSASPSENSYSPAHPSWTLPKTPYSSNICLQEHKPYMDAMYPSLQDMPPMPVLGNNYQTPINPLSSLEGNLHPSGIGLMNVQTNNRSLNGAQTVSAIGTGPSGVQSTATVTGRNAFPERPGQPECQHYLKTGNCKFAAACKFHHPRSNEQSVLRNFLLPSERKQLSIGVDYENTSKNSNDLTTSTQGSVFSTFKPVSSSTMAFPVVQTQASLMQKRIFPERPGQAECQYYLKTGDCRFGDTCLYHHPKERLEQSSACAFSSPNPPVHFVSQVHPSPFSLSEEKQHNIGISNVDATKQTNNRALTAVHSVQTSTEPMYSATMGVSTVESQELTIQRDSFPERPGQPECPYYMKTGNCKYGAVCRYHHPKETSQKFCCNLSKMGLPLNPDKPACIFYSRYGICKFGPMCNFDHPMPASTFNPSACLNPELPGDQFPKGDPSKNT